MRVETFEFERDGRVLVRCFGVLTYDRGVGGGESIGSYLSFGVLSWTGKMMGEIRTLRSDLPLRPRVARMAVGVVWAPSLLFKVESHSVGFS